MVECDEGEEEEEADEEEDEGIEEKLGRARVVEALKVDNPCYTTIFCNFLPQAHTWSNLELLESGPGRRALPIETDKESDSEGEDEQGEVGEQVVPVLLLSNRLGWRFVVSVIHSLTYWQNWCNTANLIATR